MPSLALLLLLALPLVAGVVIPVLPSGVSGRGPRGVALAAGLLQLGLAAALIWPQLQTKGNSDSIAIHQDWLPQLGLSLDLGLDGISLPLVLLAALITSLAVLATPLDQERPRLYFCLLLATNLGLIGAFLARNALLFVLAYELILIPTTLLVASFGGAKRATAAIRYLTYGAVSGLTLLAAVLALGLLQGSGVEAQAPAPSFAFVDLAQRSLDPGAQKLVLALFLVAFGLKLPLVPLHGWQPATYSQAPTPVAMLLSGAVSKLGAYGLLRFGIELLPEPWAAWSPWIAAFGAISAIYGALNGIAQGEIRRLVAYSSLGHMGLVVLALAAATPLSLQGVIAQVLAHGLIIALLFCLVGVIERKTGTTTIAELSGLLNPQRGLPFSVGLLLLGLMASAGIPGLAGFGAELLVFEGSWTTFPLPTLACLVASGLTAVYAVRLFNRVGFGRLQTKQFQWPTSSWQERLPALALSLAVVSAGLWPQLLVGLSETSTAAIAIRTPLLLP